MGRICAFVAVTIVTFHPLGLSLCKYFVDNYYLAIRRGNVIEGLGNMIFEDE